VAPSAKARVSIVPKGNTNSNHVRAEFVNAVISVAPNATGEAVGIQRAGETIVGAFVEAAGLALLSIAILLWLSLRRVVDVLLTLIPLILAAMLTLEIAVVFDLPLNFANIIALPVLLGVGVAFKIYYMVAWRAGMTNLLSSPLTRAVFFSGLTTAVAFGSLWFSNHPGTASMGRLLAIALGCTMGAAVLFQPLLMGPPRTEAKRTPSPAAPAPREHERS
jgi:predicted RND superfamily exporter protein